MRHALLAALTFVAVSEARGQPLAAPVALDTAACAVVEVPRPSRTALAEMSGARPLVRLPSAQDAFPAFSQRRRPPGRVEMRVRVGADGRVAETIVDEFDQARHVEPALRAARKWTFAPAACDGQPFETWTAVSVFFPAEPVRAPLTSRNDRVEH